MKDVDVVQPNYVVVRLSNISSKKGKNRTQGPIPEILVEIAQLLEMLKNSVFLSRPF